MKSTSDTDAIFETEKQTLVSVIVEIGYPHILGLYGVRTAVVCPNFIITQSKGESPPFSISRM